MFRGCSLMSGSPLPPAALMRGPKRLKKTLAWNPRGLA